MSAQGAVLLYTGAGAMERIDESIETITLRSYYTFTGIHGSI